MESKYNSFVMVPSQVWEGILSELSEIKSYIKDKNGQEGLGEYITEEEAKKLLGRKTTWFWAMRKKGLIKSQKVGTRVYYRRSDILTLPEQ